MSIIPTVGRGSFAAVLLLSVLLPSRPAIAQLCNYGECVAYPSTTLLEIRREQAPSREIEIVKFGGYELSDGQFRPFADWYAGRMVTTRADFVTQLTPGLGLLWGVSTGVSGEKYQMQPAGRVGLVALAAIGQHASLSLSARTTLAGRLRERPCTADYGDLGGVQQVNCRLAASELQPADTLQYLWNFPRPDQTQITLRLTASF